ncbi:hypothetical protein NDU88_005961 [Pleurodeles waltl]|uniref:Myb-like domain-containing protein n=1 Tax=Pleurodeles waltl TaxID=8319 RepID=A0AAV7TC34_PLEWA|nr:hypothetical protein NDU88_005961 [Pleurodeles waltl]
MSISSVSTTTGTPGNPTNTGRSGPGVSGSGHTIQGTEAQDNRETGRTPVRQGEDRPREPTLQEALTNILGAHHHSQETMGQILAKFQETQRLQEGQYLGIREDLKNLYTILITIAGVLADMGKTMRETVAHQRAPDTSHTEEHPPPPPALVDRRPRRRTNRPPAPHPLQKENHPANGPCDPGRSQRTLPRPPPGNRTLLIVTLVSTHQKKGIWRAIAKEVRTLGVFDRRSTYCHKRWEDLRRWAKKTVEAQLGLASQRGRGARRTMAPLMFRILAVAHLELDGRLKASQQPHGATTSATKSTSAVVPATHRGSKGAPVSTASVPPTPAKDKTIPPPAKVKRGTACSKAKEHKPPRKASSKTPGARAKVTPPSAKMRKGQKTPGKALQPSEAADEGLVATCTTASTATCTAASTASSPPLAPAPAPPPAPPLAPILSAAAAPVGSRPWLQERGWNLPPQLAALPPALPLALRQAPPQAPPPAPLTVGPLPAAAAPVGSRPRLQEKGWTLPPPLAAPPPALALPTVCSLIPRRMEPCLHGLSCNLFPANLVPQTLR